jgi:GTPase Era involved in 16S rRNA processing
LTQEHEEQENGADDSKESVISEKDAYKKVVVGQRGKSRK